MIEVEPDRHRRYGGTGITDETAEGYRTSSYFMPIPASKVRGKQWDDKETQLQGRVARAATNHSMTLRVVAIDARPKKSASKL